MLAAVLVAQAAGNAGLRQSRLPLDDRPQGAAGPAGVVTERSGDAGGSGQPQDGDDQVACSLNYGTTLQFRRLPSHGGRLPSCPESPVRQVHNRVATARALPKGTCGAESVAQILLAAARYLSLSRRASVCGSTVTCDNTRICNSTWDCSENTSGPGWAPKDRIPATCAECLQTLP